MTGKNPVSKSLRTASGKRTRMEMTVGIRTAEEAEYFLTRGADEVYCGLPEIPNHGIKAENFSSIKEIHRTIDLAHSLDKKAFLVANDIFPAAGFDKAVRTVAALVERGMDGVIIRDIAMLDYFKKKKIRTFFTLSTLALCFNRGAMDFFRERGVSRIVLPQQLSVEEAAPFFNNEQGIEIEIFCLPLFYEVNLNPLCTLWCPCNQEIIPGKKPRPFTCQSLLNNSGTPFRMPLPDTRWLLSTLYDFYHLGADCMKVARGPNLKEVIEVFNNTVYLMKLLEKGISRELFIFEGSRAIKEAQNYGKNYIFNAL